ncbi:MAG TPA: hypothetical protein VKS60_25840, partial [Stellaceae bacterium]|nr:hypothetical protein [Stellaceae bacterium]
MAKAPKPRSIGKETVEAMKPGEWLWDSELRGFGVRCRPSKDGSGGEAANDKPRCRRYYVIKFRAKGQQRWVTIGEHGSPWTPKQARMEALRLLAAVKVEGADPAAVREEDKRAITVEQLCRRYLAAAESGAIHGKRRQPKKASTIATDRGRIERHIIPLLGKRRVKDVMRADVEQFKNYVTAGKTAADIKTKRHGRAIVEGGAGTATRTIGLLGGIFTYAIEQGVIKENPVRGVKRRADNRRETRLSPDQYRALGKALAELETEGETRQA